MLSKASEIPKPECLFAEWNSLIKWSKLIIFKEVWTPFSTTTWQMLKGESYYYRFQGMKIFVNIFS